MGIPVETIRTDGFEMRYFRFGSGERNLVILPGISVTSVMSLADAIAKQYERFTHDFTVWVFDRRSDLPASYPVSGMASDTAKAIESAGLKDICLFGASQGGMIAMLIAAEHPGLVKKLVLGSTACRVSEEKFGEIGRWIELAKEGDGVGLYLEFGRAVYPAAVFESYKNVLTSLGRSVTEEDLQRFIVLAEGIRGFDASRELSEIRCPVLVTGAEDDGVLGSNAARDIAEKLRNSELQLYNGYGHASYDTAPEYGSDMLAFLTDLPHSLHMEKIANARELGGYAGEGGRKIVRGRLLRTAALADASPRDLKRLTGEFDVRLIIDLREKKEAAAKPDPELPGVRYLQIDVMDPARFGEDNKKDAVERNEEQTFEEHAAEIAGFTEMPDIEQLYVYLLQEAYGAAAFSRIFREILAVPEGAVLWHCAAGKDRTGVVAALLLAALGADRETIMEDYLLTNDFSVGRIADTKRRLLEIGYDGKRAEAITNIWEGANPVLMENALRSLEMSNGSIMGYLKERLSLTDADISKLRERYLI